MSEAAIRPVSGGLLVRKDVLRELSKKRSFGSLPLTLFNVGAYIILCLTGAWVNTWWAWPIVWWFQGFILSGFIGASHECVHGTFATGRRVNRIAGALWSSMILLNFTIYKHYHIEHHKYTGVPNDTETPYVFRNLWDYVCSLPETGFFVAFWSMSVNAMFGRFPHFIRTKSARRAVLEDVYVLFFWVLLTIGATIIWPKLLLFYWCPIVFYFPMVFLTSLPEHYGCDEGPDLVTNTRSLSSNFIFRVIFWNGNYHAEHHVYPAVPAYNLPKLHALIGNQFKFREGSYVLFHLKLIKSLIRAKTPQGQVFIAAPK